MKYLNALNTINGLGSKTLRTIMNHFDSGQEAWEASAKQLMTAGVGENLARKIAAERESVDIEKEWQKLAKENIQVFSIKDAQYPSLLKQIPDPPYLIYMKGNLKCLDLPMIAMVGSRKLTFYGQQVAFGLARDLAKSGVCIVSGLAFGIDAASHSGALEAHGKTIAVLGNSLDDFSIAPKSNFQLAQEILSRGGLLVSEFPVQTSANVGTFPARNRIMAAMSSGTLVIEAADKSGSLITANLALDYNRDVFAVPGPITSAQSFGTNLLIKKGAKLVSSAQDVLEELNLSVLNEPCKQTYRQTEIELPEQEEKIYRVLGAESNHIDIITKLTKLDTSTVASTLAILEIKGLIKNVGGQIYIKL